VDDGLLDVQVYETMGQPTLAARFAAVKAGTVGEDARVRCSVARRVEIRSALPLPVVVDSKLVGSTPVCFRTLAGALLVIAGRGDGLARPAALPLVSAIKDSAGVPPAPAVASQVTQVGPATGYGRSAATQLAKQGRPLGIALIAGAAITLAPALARWMNRRRR
jgi:hypothetical protein